MSREAVFACGIVLTAVALLNLLAAVLEHPVTGMGTPVSGVEVVFYLGLATLGAVVARWVA